MTVLTFESTPEMLLNKLQVLQGGSTNYGLISNSFVWKAKKSVSN